MNKDTNRIKKYIRRIVMLICMVVFVYSAYSLIKIHLKYRAIDNLNLEIVNNYVVKKEGRFYVDWENLLKRNSDVVGWLYFPNTNIDFPILHGSDNNFYLHHDINRNASIAGSIFMDKRNDSMFTDINTIIYGHNMRNDSMFSDINRIAHGRIEDYSSYIYVYLPNNTLKTYKIVSINKTDTSNPIFIRTINNIEELSEMMLEGQIRSNPWPDNHMGRLLMLSTCGDGGLFEYTQNRSIIFAILISEENLID